MLPNDVPTPTDDVHTHHHHAASTGHPWLDKILPISALLVSAISIGIAIHHGHIMDQMAKANERAAAASAWPFLSADGGLLNDEKAKMYFKIRNNGIGPAKLESFQMFYKDKPLKNLQQLMENCCIDSQAINRSPAEIFRSSTDSMATGEAAPAVIAQKDSILIFEWAPNKDGMPLLQRLGEERIKGNFTMKACYCSVFDQCWTSNLTETKQTAVSSCPKEDHQFQAAIF